MILSDSAATATRSSRDQLSPADLDLVVPARNEEERIGPTIVALSEHLASRPWRSRILVVDNGSVDGTSEVVDGHVGAVPIEVIGCRARGKGAAVQMGMAHSTARWVGYCDADLSTPAATVDDGVNLLRRGYRVVVGSRRCEGADYLVSQPVSRRIGSRVFQVLAGRMVGGISDTQCGFKLFEGEVGRRLFASSRVAGFAFDVEVLALAHHQGLSVIEVPVAWSDRDGSTFRPLTDGIRAVSDLRTVRRAMQAHTAALPERQGLSGLQHL